MSTSQITSPGIFHPEDNACIDRSLPPTRAPAHLNSVSAISSSLFLDSYLAYRLSPRARPDPRRPYTAFDAVVLQSLRAAIDHGSVHLSGTQLLEVALLFPSDQIMDLLQGRTEDLTSAIAALSNAIEIGDEDAVAGVEMILRAALAGASVAISCALSKNRSVQICITTLRRWRDSYCQNRTSKEDESSRDYIIRAVRELENILRSSLKTDGELNVVLNASASKLFSEMVQLVQNALPDTDIEDIRAALRQCDNNVEEAVGILLDGMSNGNAGAGSSSEPKLKTIGKRTEKRNLVKDVANSDTFSGSPAELDGGYGWIQKRVNAELARQATIDPDDPRDHTSAYTFLVDGMMQEETGGIYDDDPDDAVLEGEESNIGSVAPTNSTEKGDFTSPWSSELEPARGQNQDPPIATSNLSGSSTEEGESMFDNEGSDCDDSSATPTVGTTTLSRQSIPLSRGQRDGRGDSHRREGGASGRGGREGGSNHRGASSHRPGRGGSRGRSRGRGRGGGPAGRGGRGSRRDAAAKKQARAGL